MLTYTQLIEITLNQLKPDAKLDDFEKAAGSQGIKLGRREKKGHHVDYPDAVHKKSGKPARTQDNKVIGGSADGSKGSSKSTAGTHQKKLKDAVVAAHKPKVNQKAGQENVGYWKNPDKKEQRIADAKRNKEAKRKKRDPFTREHSEWWLNMWRIDEGQQAQAGANRRANPPQTKVNKQAGQAQREAAKQREARKAAANQQVADKEKMARALPPDRDQAAKDRAARNKAAQDRVAAKEREVGKPRTRPVQPVVNPVSRPATTEQGPKAPAQQGPERDPNPKARAAMERRNKEAEAAKEKRDRQAAADKKAKKQKQERKAKEDIAKRKTGIGGGIKSALGGDVIGMSTRGKNKAETKEIKKQNRQARGDFAKKKVQQTGNLVKSTGRKALDLGKKSVTDGPGSSGPDSVQGSTEIVRGKRA
jgi:hypothetical protein